MVRAKYPNLSAHQIIRRITETAHNPPRGVDNKVGYGVVDPVAALTFDVAPGDPLPASNAGHRPCMCRRRRPPRIMRPRHTALIGGAAVVVLAAAAAAIAAGPPEAVMKARTVGDTPRPARSRRRRGGRPWPRSSLCRRIGSMVADRGDSGAAVLLAADVHGVPAQRARLGGRPGGARRRRRHASPVAAAVDIPHGAIVCGVRVDGDEAITMIGVDGQAYSPTLLRGSAKALTPNRCRSTR